MELRYVSNPMPIPAILALQTISLNFKLAKIAKASVCKSDLKYSFPFRESLRLIQLETLLLQVVWRCRSSVTMLH